MNNRILIIDDDEIIRKFIKEVISLNFKLEIVTAKSGIEALEHTSNTKFDIILCDISMPEMDGFETVERIKNQNTNRNTSIIFITAFDPNKEKLNQGINAGAIDYLIKPITGNFLVSTIKLHLRLIEKEEQINSELIQTIDKLKNEEVKTKQLCEALHITKDNFESIVGKSDAAILITDNEGILRFVNKMGEKIFMRKADEIIGESFGFMFETGVKDEIDIIRKNGEIGRGEVISTRTQWQNNPAILIMINDITEHVELQNNLKKAKESAQQSDELKTAFLANMSHEIRTPMNAIVGFSQLLNEEDISDDDKKQFIQLINSRSQDLLVLINDIVDISKVEAGLLKIVPKECSLDKILLEINHSFSSNRKIIDGNIDFKLTRVLNKQKSKVITDEVRIKQVLINLINNAIKYTSEGYINLGFTLEEYDSQQFVQFFVEDTGIGLSKEDQEIVFKRFRQVEDKSTKLVEGTGLGLSISDSLVHLLGGDIWVESESGKGSTFFFTIPYKQVAQELPLIPIIPREEEIKPKEKIKTILIVDDEITNCLLLQHMLKKQAKILFAYNGNEAIDSCNENSEIDLVLMDIRMPECSGIEAFKKIRSNRKNLPVIAQTSYALTGESEEIISQGFDDYISKPINKTKLFELINKHLDL